MLDLSTSTLLSTPASWLMLAQEKAPAATEAATKVASEGGGMQGKFLFLIVLILLAFLLGWGISKALKMKEISGRLTAVMLAMFIGLSPFLFRLYEGLPLSSAIRLGIDLAGGTNMVFQVYTDEGSEKEITNEVMDQMVSAVIRRVNPSGAEDVAVRKVGVDRIEVIIPGADPETIEAKKKLISRLGSLEFGVLANRRDHRPLIDAASSLPEDQDLYRVGNQAKAAWRDPGRIPEGEGKFKFKDITRGGEVATRTVTRYGRTYDQFLVLVNPAERRITGENLSRVSPTSDENGAPAVSFNLDATGARNMRRLSGDNLPSKDGFDRRLAILLDETVHQAPSINEGLSSSIQISGMSSRGEVRELINVLNAGALKVPIKPDPISEFSISPLLGQDVREKGLFSIMLATVIVFVFMLVYYLRSGVIANLCLLLNLILVLGAMSIFDATFTLPGLAGLVLTIGMAVDANVLIFERIREEKARGSSQRMAVQNGFSKVMSTIIDANVTTLITAVILFIIGSDQVRGFAVTLFIGIVMSMFSALFFGRLLFDIGERKRILGDLKMLDLKGLIAGDKNDWDFLKLRKFAAVFSMLFIIGGMVVFANRGEENLDIDFTGGTMVTFELEKPAPIEEIRDILEAKFGNITLERLTLDGEEGDIGRRYRMRTKLRDVEPEAGAEEQDSIQVMVGQAFEGQAVQPRRVTVEFGELVPIAAAETEEPSADENAPAPVPDSLYAGGNNVELTFSEELSPTTAELYFSGELARVGGEGNQKYELPDELFEVKGTGGSGTEAASETTVQTFNKMEINVSPTVSVADLNSVLISLQQHMADNPTFDEVNSFDSSIAQEMRYDAVLAILASLLAIVFYIWIRFDKVTFGLAAVVALVHDVLIVLGLVAIASVLSATPLGPILMLNDFKINLPMIAAFLTIVGYSLNDTIVVFDRIREVRGKNPAMTTSMINNSLNQTLSRTLLTSLTTLMVVVILYVSGGEGIHGFAFCLVAGVIVGTYSSIYVAAPVLLWLINRPGSEIGMATQKALEEEAKREERQTAAAST